MTPQFGRAIRSLWRLSDDATLLNHGSFGACPKDVLSAQDAFRQEMELQPDVFFRERIMPNAGNTALRAAAGEIAAFVNVEADNIALIENASAGIQAVLRSITLRPGDKIMITDHTYNAVRLAVEARCAETGAEIITVKLPIPTTTDDIIGRFSGAITASVKLVIVDHITSPTALVLPLERLLPELRQHGARILVDGAHAVGQIPLDLVSLRPDWYVSNAHKWLFAPKGSAFLYASPDVTAFTQPNVVSHFIDLRFPRSFDYTGTRDNTAWLAIPAALAFFQKLGPSAVWTYQKDLIATCSEHLTALGAEPVAPLDMHAAMRTFILPQTRAANADDGITLMNQLWKNDRIQVAAGVLGGKLLLRISAQIYVTADDMKYLKDALDRHGWPGR